MELIWLLFIIELQESQCPKVASIPSGCIAAAMMLHITPSSDGYFENMWGWVADHDLDDAQNTMVTVAAARGFLIESTAGPTWFYGTASEHSMLYQYNFHNTSNSFAGMIQTESPYFQGTAATQSPGPFAKSIGKFNNDPVFDNSSCTGTDLSCDISWAVMVNEVNNLTIAGAGLYSWFDNYDQSTCVDGQNCQQRLFNDQGTNGGLYVWNLITIGAVEMVSNTMDNTTVSAKDNTQANMHPFWSALAAYADSSTPQDQTCDDENPDPSCAGPPICDKSRSFNSLEELQSAAGSFPAICMPYYALTTLLPTLNASLTKYATVNNGYDAVYSYYIEYVKDFVPGALSKFMEGNSYNSPGGEGNQFFDCVFDTGHGKPQTLPCPIDWHVQGDQPKFSITYQLKNETGFYDTLKKKYGIEKDWVSLDLHNFYHPPKCSGGDGGGGGGGGIGNTLRARCIDSIIHDWYGLPQATDKINPTNPKDVITKALPTIDQLKASTSNRLLDVAGSTWQGTTDDLLQVLSMPIYMISQAVNSMETVKEHAVEQQKQDKAKLIQEVLGIVCLFIPFLQEVAPEVAAADAIFEIVGATVNIGLAIKGIIDDPVSAPMEILGLLTFGGARDEKDFKSLADKRRGISKDDIEAIGEDFEKLDDKLQKTIRQDCKK